MLTTNHPRGIVPVLPAPGRAWLVPPSPWAGLWRCWHRWHGARHRNSQTRREQREMSSGAGPERGPAPGEGLQGPSQPKAFHDSVIPRDPSPDTAGPPPTAALQPGQPLPLAVHGSTSQPLPVSPVLPITPGSSYQNAPGLLLGGSCLVPAPCPCQVRGTGSPQRCSLCSTPPCPALCSHRSRTRGF